MLQNENMICGAVICKEAALHSCLPRWGRNPERGQTGVQQNYETNLDVTGCTYTAPVEGDHVGYHPRRPADTKPGRR